MKAMNHALLARYPVLATEDSEAYNEYRRIYLDFHQPCNAVELDLVDDIVSILWRLRRAEEIEVALQDMEIDALHSGSPPSYCFPDRGGIWALGFARLAARSRAFESLQRHQRCLQLRYAAACRRLEAMRRRRTPAIRAKSRQAA